MLSIKTFLRSCLRGKLSPLRNNMFDKKEFCLRTIASYNNARHSSLSFLPNRAIEAFTLIGFSTTGYPTQIFSPEELWRFHDSQQEGTLEENVSLLGDISGDDSLLLESVASQIYKITSDFPYRSCGKQSLSRSFNSFAFIRLWPMS